jgi:hypothetical protein
MARLFLLVAVLWAGCSAVAPAQELFVHVASQVEGGGADNAPDTVYVWRVLRAALERTRPAYGNFRLEEVASMPYRRQIRALADQDSALNVGVFAADAELGRELFPVRIPIDRGLLGYRVLLVRQADLAKFSHISSLADLKPIRFGLMPVWSDGAVMRAAGLTVVPGDSHDGLFRMLAVGRFDAFSRGVAEILPDEERARRSIPGLAVEPHLLLHYPLPLYFWFSLDDAGRRRAARVEAGLRDMVADGTLQKMYSEEYAALFGRLGLDHRLVIELPNPLLGDNDPLADESLWYRPSVNATAH